LNAALPAVFAVDTGVVVIVVAVAVVLVVLIVALSLRGRQVRAAKRQQDLGEAHERAGRAERDRGIAEGQEGRPTDEAS
jgi:uncharacterized membrane protein